MKNYYQILGLLHGATKEEIRKAYRVYATKFHPDKQGGDDFFEEEFKEIQEAYEILSDDKKRKNYDLKFNQHSTQDNKEIDNLKQKVAEREREINNLKQKTRENGIEIDNLKRKEREIYNSNQKIKKKEKKRIFFIVSFVLTSIFASIFAIYFYSEQESLSNRNQQLEDEKRILTEESQNKILNLTNENNIQKNEIEKLKEKIPQEYKVIVYETYGYRQCAGNFYEEEKCYYDYGEIVEVFHKQNNYGLTRAGWLKMSDLKKQ